MFKTSYNKGVTYLNNMMNLNEVWCIALKRQINTERIVYMITYIKGVISNGN